VKSQEFSFWVSIELSFPEKYRENSFVASAITLPCLVLIDAQPFFPSKYVYFIFSGIFYLLFNFKNGDRFLFKNFMMMDEHEILTKISSISNLFIPEGVFIWSWWKRFYLEDIQKRNLFSQTLDFDSFSQLIKSTTRPSKYFPNFVRKDTRKIRDWIKELFIYFKFTLSPDLPFKVQDSTSFSGLCLISQDTNAISKEFLWGILYYISEDTRDALVQLNYPSLYQHGKDCAIVCGPLALVNHSCSSPFGFSLPTIIYPNDELDCFFDGCHMISLRYIGSDNNSIKKQEEEETEITVRYAPKKDLSFQCKCDFCSNF